MSVKKIKGALISVYYKDGLLDIARELDRCGVTIYSTGGTQSFLQENGIHPVAVESLTDYPSILGGRVKTLHPKVFGGILSRRDNAGDGQQMAEYGIPEIDLVIVDLYPFEQTVASGAQQQDVIEKIDIGGISLIRAAAKNFKDVVIVPSVAQYGALLTLLKGQGCATTLEQRQWFATQAFNVSSHYDSSIFNYFNGAVSGVVSGVVDGVGGHVGAFKVSVQGEKVLRYGENPHQKAAFYGDFDAMFEKLNGKDVSYNNLLDIDAAVGLISEFTGRATFAILKHNNACGVGERDTLVEAWKAALAGDPVSAFGGVLICNRELDIVTAGEVNGLFCEVIIAPGYASGVLDVLRSKKNRIILRAKQPFGELRSAVQFRSLLGGVAVQERDSIVGGDLLGGNGDRGGSVAISGNSVNQVTDRAVTGAELEELIFANKIVKHSKSNAIVLVKDHMLVGSGVGQTSRVDALRQAIAKAEGFGLSLKGAVMASDAFFPFGDCVEIAHQAGVDCVIQPGGSVRDGESVDYCNAHGMAMVTTSVRHFKH